MGIVRKQSILSTIVLAIGVVLGFVLRLEVFPRYLQPNEIGLLTLLVDVSNLIAALIPFGGYKIIIRYFPHYPPGKERTKLFIYVLKLALAGFGVFLAAYFIFAEQVRDFYAAESPLLGNFLWAIVPMVLARLIYHLFSRYAQALKNVTFELVLREIGARLLTLAVVLSYAWKFFDLRGMVLAYLAVYGLLGLIMFAFVFRRERHRWKPAPGSLRKDERKGILNFGFFSILTIAGTQSMRNIDSLMITSLLNLSEAGIYSIVFFMGKLIEIPRRALSRIAAPFVAEATARKEMSKLGDLYRRSSLNQLIVGSTMLLCVWLNLDDIFDFMPNGDLYREGKYVAVIIGFAMLFNMSMGVNNEIIGNSRYYKINFYTVILMAILGISTNLLLIPAYGTIGAAMATLLTTLITNSVKSVFILWKFKLHPFDKNGVYAILGAGVLGVLIYLLPLNFAPVVNIALRTVLIILSFGIFVLGFRLSEDINELSELVIKRIKRMRR